MARFRHGALLFLLVWLLLFLAGAAPVADARPTSPLSPSAPAVAVTIPHSTTTPNIDGSCSSGGLGGPEYGDATQFPFTVTVGIDNYPVIVFIKHTIGTLYICMVGLIVPAAPLRQGPNAAVYIDRTGLGGTAPNSDTFSFSISYSGTVAGVRGGSNGYNGPAPINPDDFMADRTWQELSWDAEFGISHLLLGQADWTTTGQTIGLVVAQQWVSFGGDDYGWPSGYYWDVPDTWGEGNLIPGGAAASRNFSWTALEVTQGIQDLANSVALVANKRTFVRGHVLTNETGGPMTARLRGWRAGVSLGPPLLPRNPGASIIAYLNPNRGSLNDSFVWDIPAAWTTAGTISITADLNPYHNPSESTYGDNSHTVTGLAFQTVHPLQIRLYDVQYTTSGGNLVTTSQFDQQMLESWLRREYPIGTLFSSRRVVRVMGSNNPLVLDIGAAALWVTGLMDQQRNAFANSDPGWLYVGQVGNGGGFMRGITPWMPAWTTAAPTGGTPFCPGNGGPCFDFDGSWGDWYGAHEIGHALGRPHVGRTDLNIGCGADWYFWQAPYPHTTAIIGGTSFTTNRFYGFDAGHATLNLPIQVIPNTWTDNMSYCSFQWISDWNYLAIRDYINSAFPALALAAPAPSAAAAPAAYSSQNWPYRAALNSPASPLSTAPLPARPASPAAPQIVGDYLFVHAAIFTPSQTAEIDLIARLPEVGSLTPLETGGYELRLFDVGDTLLTTYPVSPPMSSEGGGNLILSQIVTFTAGTRRVAVFSTEAGSEIASVAVSANSPVVSSVLHTGGSNLPATGAVTVTWSASDLDGGLLHYALQYSFSGNGGPWRTLATGLSAMSATVDAGELESTGFGALSGYFRVVATDGVNTGSDISVKFSVDDKPPVAGIASPISFTQFGFGQTVSLVGEGQDFEDGTLSGGALCWVSSFDGALGCAPEINPTFLSTGIHQITLTVTDSEGLTGTADVYVQILDDAHLLIPTSPVLEVSPSAGMLFLAEAGGPNPAAQELTVHDLAGTALGYTATVNQPWVTLNALDGTTPGVISVTVSAAGMLAGTSRTAQITVAAAGAGASPQIIHLTLQTEGEPPKVLYVPWVSR